MPRGNRRKNNQILQQDIKRDNHNCEQRYMQIEGELGQIKNELQNQKNNNNNLKYDLNLTKNQNNKLNNDVSDLINIFQDTVNFSPSDNKSTRYNKYHRLCDDMHNININNPNLSVKDLTNIIKDMEKCIIARKTYSNDYFNNFQNLRDVSEYKGHLHFEKTMQDKILETLESIKRKFMPQKSSSSRFGNLNSQSSNRFSNLKTFGGKSLQKKFRTWLKNKLINPDTGRKIRKNGPMYKWIETKCIQYYRDLITRAIKSDYDIFKNNMRILKKDLDKPLLKKVINSSTLFSEILTETKYQVDKIKKVKLMVKNGLDIKKISKQEQWYDSTVANKLMRSKHNKEINKKLLIYLAKKGLDIQYSCETVEKIPEIVKARQKQAHKAIKKGLKNRKKKNKNMEVNLAKEISKYMG